MKTQISQKILDLHPYCIPAVKQTMDTSLGFNLTRRKKGMDSVNLLIQLATNNGLTLKEIDKQYKNKSGTTLYEHIDMTYHIDYLVYNKEEEIISALDVKTFYSSDAYYQVEVKNVNGESGWLYGEASHIVWVNHFDHTISIVPRQSLVEFIESIDIVFKNKDMSNIHEEDILHSTYRRSTRNDEVYFLTKQTFSMLSGATIYNYRNEKGMS